MPVDRVVEVDLKGLGPQLSVGPHDEALRLGAVESGLHDPVVVVGAGAREDPPNLIAGLVYYDVNRAGTDAIHARQWQDYKEGKQAEFLIERQFPWGLISRIGVSSRVAYSKVLDAIADSEHQPKIEVRTDWYD